MPFATVAIASLPTTRTDGSALSASDLSAAQVYKNGAVVGAIAAPIAVGSSFTDTVAAVNGDVWTATVLDKQTPPAESTQSAPQVVSGVVTTLAAPGAPTITLSVA